MAGMSSRLPDELRALLGEMVSDIGERVYLRSEAAGVRQRHDISVISAPVYDHHQRQSMVASLQIGRALTDTEIAKRARRLVATADALTNQLGGVKPRRCGLTSELRQHRQGLCRCHLHTASVLVVDQRLLDGAHLVGFLRVIAEVAVELPYRDKCRLPGGTSINAWFTSRMRGEIFRQRRRHRTDGGGQTAGVAVDSGLSRVRRRLPGITQSWRRPRLLRAVRTQSDARL